MTEEARARLRMLDARTIAGVALWHAVLLGAVVWGRVPYLVLQALVVVEIVLFNIASIAVLRRRRLAAHLRDVARSLLGGSVLIGFVVVAWLVMMDEVEPGRALAGAIAGFDSRGFAWAGGYLLAHVVVAALLALRATDPPLAWVREAATTSTASLLALLAMVLVGFFAIFLVPNAWLRTAPEGVDLAFSVATVVLRFGFSLLTATFRDSEIAEIVATVERD